jgi:hypothetical protein
MDQIEKYVKWDKFDGKIVYKISSGVKKSFLEIFSFEGNWVTKWGKVVGEWKGKMRTAAIKCLVSSGGENSLWGRISVFTLGQTGESVTKICDNKTITN